jgi:hypothetical protein
MSSLLKLADLGVTAYSGSYLSQIGFRQSGVILYRTSAHLWGATRRVPKAMKAHTDRLPSCFCENIPKIVV